MAPVTPIRLTVDPVLSAFFAEQGLGAPGGTRRRIAAAELDLRRCMDVEAETLLTEAEQHLLESERRSSPDGAAARVAEPEAVLLVLPTFLDDPRWHGLDLVDRRLRVRLAIAFAHHLVGLPAMRGMEVGCAIMDLEAAVDRSREATRALKAV